MSAEGEKFEKTTNETCFSSVKARLLFLKNTFCRSIELFFFLNKFRLKYAD